MRLPLFLKVAYAAIACGCAGWFFLIGAPTAAQAAQTPVAASPATPVYLWAFTAVALTLAAAAVVTTLRQVRGR